MVVVPTSSALGLWFKTIKLVCVASPLSTQHKGERTKTGWLGIRIMCPSAAICISGGYCFRELAL